MPYIGNSHIAGDHVNNFKVLDDISSYTATFDGSATSVVDTTNNTIRVVEHRFIQGQRVTYTNGGGGNIGGLTTGTAYFVIYDTAFTIKLATNASNAANSTAINLSSVGSGTSHTLNAAFDGTNTKFKLTHGSGVGARLNNATQLNVAINNVVQRPNQSALTFTEGFAIEDNHKIVFKVAPTSEDIFWGSIIANTITTFDISDHKIDTFTGDGSTTEFTLSHTPANNESLMVTINGVLQHPSNASTARAYTLIASIIQFTAAPGVGDEIQVRHIGFAGATTADVSGFYGRTGNVVLTDQDDIIVNKISVGTGATIESNGQATFVGVVTFGSSSTTIEGDNNLIKVGTALTLGHTQGLQFHTQNLHSDGFEINNINASGIITASQFVGNIGGNPTFSGDTTFNGSVSIGGTLTYEDVTNIDSVGIITARDGIDCNADLDVDGHTNLDNTNIVGMVTVTTSGDYQGPLINGNICPTVRFATSNNTTPLWKVGLSGNVADTFAISDGATSNDRLTVNATKTTINGYLHTGNIQLDHKIYHTSDTNNHIEFGTDLQHFYTNGSERLKIQHSGIIVTGVSTFSASAHVSNASGSVFFGAGNATAYGSQGGIGRAGGSNYHIGSSAVGDLCIAAEGSKRILFGTKTGTGIGGVTKRMSIASSGQVTIDGNLDAVGGIDATANSTFAGDIDVDGHTNLDNVSIAGVTTFSNNIVATGNADISGRLTSHSARFEDDGTSDNPVVSVMADDHNPYAFQVGNSTYSTSSMRGHLLFVMNDGDAYHDFGSNTSDYTDVFFRLRNSSGTFKNCISFEKSDQSVELYAEGSKKFETTNDGINVIGHSELDSVNVAGIITASSFVGDGSGLTGITASGSGVVIKHDGSTVGTAGTINFSTNLDVSAISAGIVTVTASGGGVSLSGSTNNTVATVTGANALIGEARLTFDGNTLGIAAGSDEKIQMFGTNPFIRFKEGSTDKAVIQWHSDGHIRLINQEDSSQLRIKDALEFSTDSSTFYTVWHAGNDGASSGLDADLLDGQQGSYYTNAANLTGTLPAIDGSNLTGVSANIGITTNLSGTFTASAGSPSTINTFGYGSGDLVVEYTIYIKNGSDFQTQKLLAMRDGTTIHSTQFAVMFSSSLLVQCDATISSGNILLRATPETGVSGSTTYKVKREVM